MKRPGARCINLDWLELYCYEPLEPRDINYFERLGISVRDREYGTRHWSQVFTLVDDRGEDFLEVRRCPRAKVGEHHTILPDNACTLRLVNRYCYYDTAMPIMADFLERHGYQFRRIFRLDLCLDLVKFDSGDDPQDVMRRISRHIYAKVYQARRSIHGEDRWNACDDNSVSWGKKGSMVVTRFYNKTMELAEQKDKPWIRQAWYECDLVDDPATCLLRNPDGTFIHPCVWRLEYQINSSARGWFVIDGGERTEYVEHTIEAYWNRENILQAFANLTEHYFQFRIYRQGVRKYDCKPKVLFDFGQYDKTYRLRNSLVRRVYPETSDRWLRMLQAFRLTLTNQVDRELVDRLIASQEQTKLLREGYDYDDALLERMRNAVRGWHRQGTKPVSVDTGRDSDIFDT